MTQSQSIQSALVGSCFSRFAVGTGFDLYFEDFVLSAQEIVSSDEETINVGLVNSYPPSTCTANPEYLAKSIVLAACLAAEISAVNIFDDSSLVLRFNNGSEIRLRTDTPLVDWHWAFTESGGDPYSGCLVACFAPGDIQGSMSEFLQVRHAPNRSFKPNA